MKTTREEWPYEEARRILDRVGDPNKEIILQTGFGPSGLPHIGTFGEVTRTTFIKYALQDLGAKNVRLIVFSDDMDGLRKVPDGFPDTLREHIGRPLSFIPFRADGYSYSGHMNDKLNEMLHRFGFEYEFRSSTDEYYGGVFNAGILKMLENVEAVRDIILPTIGEDKRDAWSPFMPICSLCGKMTTQVTAYHKAEGMVSYACACKASGRLSVTDGFCKMGWKADWALRWFTYGVTYEMYGKDLIESAKLSGEIVKAIGGAPPLGYFFELFLDETGKKISKSVGKDITVDQWLKYAPTASMKLFMYRNPRRAKKLFIATIPQFVDEMLDEAEAHYGNPTAERSVYSFINPNPPKENPYISGLRFSTLTGLALTTGMTNPDILIGHLKDKPGWPTDESLMRELIDCAMSFYMDYGKDDKIEYAGPSNDTEREALSMLHAYLGSPHPGAEIQVTIYNIGKQLGIPSKDMFRTLYIILMGHERGPRLGAFIELLGQDKARDLLSQYI